jgi:hypothetical protein
MKRVSKTYTRTTTETEYFFRGVKGISDYNSVKFSFPGFIINLEIRFRRINPVSVVDYNNTITGYTTYDICVKLDSDKEVSYNQGFVSYEGENYPEKKLSEAMNKAFNYAEQCLIAKRNEYDKLVNELKAFPED